MNNLRPTKFDDIIGQVAVVDILRVTVKSASHRNDAIPHTLFNGPPGLGKTTLAVALANERGVDIQIANGGNIRGIKQILPYLMRITEHSVLFIDEIHRLTPIVEEFLYPVMEDYRVDVGADDKVSIDVPKFTLIGATTEAGALSPPLYDRFTTKCHLEPYSVKELTKLIKINAEKLSINLSKDAVREIAVRGRHTPRITNSHLEWIRDWSVAKSLGQIAASHATEAFDAMGIDDTGATKQDRLYMAILGAYGKPVGLNTLVSATQIDRDTIEGVIEPFLIRQKLIEKTSKGRVLV